MSILHDATPATIPADWPAWTDEDRWAPTDPAADVPAEALADDGTRLTLPEWLDTTAARLEAQGPLGAFLGSKARELASLARLTGANTPGDLDDRLAALDATRDAEALGAAEDHGFRAGLLAAGASPE